MDSRYGCFTVIVSPSESMGKKKKKNSVTINSKNLAAGRP